jgi:hypothetical protein
MKDIELDCQVASSVVSDLNPLQDWTIDADLLLATLATDTAQLLEAVKKHFLKIGKLYRNILNIAEESGESKQAQLFFKQNFNAALRKDLEKGRKFWDYIQQLEDVEEDINFILSGTGFDGGNAIIGKLPDTLSKVEFPGVLEDPITKKLDVGASILAELVEITIKEKDGVEKTGVKSSDIGRLIKLHSVPDCDRVEFKENHATYRAEVVDYCPDTDAIKVKVDGSGEEKEIPRGTIALKEQKPPKLHEPCLIQGDELENYNRCGIFKALVADDKALVLLLDGRLVEVPKKSIVKGKKGSPIPELLYLLDESGNADKVTLAVEKAVEKTTKTFQKQIDELTTEVGKAYADGQISVAAEAREMQPNISLDLFLDIPVQEKLEIFKAQPEEAQNLILADYVKSLPIENVDHPVVNIKTPVVEPVDRPVVEIQASAAEVLDRPLVKTSTSVAQSINNPVVDTKTVVEVETPVAIPVAIQKAQDAQKGTAEILPAAPKPLSLEEQITEAEEEYAKAVVALEAKEQELGVKPGSHLTNYVVKRQCTAEVKAKNNSDTKRCRLKLNLKALSESTVQESEITKAEIIFSEEDITKADDLLLRGYRAIEDGAKVQVVLKEMSVEFPQVADYLASLFGKEWLCLYYLKNAADAQLIVRSVVFDQKQADGILDRAIDCMEKLGEIAEHYQRANFSALEMVDSRLKMLAKLLLTEKELAKFAVAEKSKPKPDIVSKVISPSSAKVTTTFAVKDDPANSHYTKETIQEWLCEPSSRKNGIAYLETNGIPLTDTFSASELQAMYDGGGQKQVSAITLVDHFKCRNLINFESIANFGSKHQKPSSPQPRQLPPKVEAMGSPEEIPGGF